MVQDRQTMQKRICNLFIIFIKEAVKYLLHNCFFHLGNKTFKQVIGIPMGSKPAIFLANLFLHYYESK